MTTLIVLADLFSLDPNSLNDSSSIGTKLLYGVQCDGSEDKLTECLVDSFLCDGATEQVTMQCTGGDELPSKEVFCSYNDYFHFDVQSSR